MDKRRGRPPKHNSQRPIVNTQPGPPAQEVSPPAPKRRTTFRCVIQGLTLYMGMGIAPLRAKMGDLFEAEVDSDFFIVLDNHSAFVRADGPSKDVLTPAHKQPHMYRLHVPPAEKGPNA